MTPPRLNSRASEASSTGTEWPPKPAIRSRPIWRRSDPDGMRERFYNLPVSKRGIVSATAPTRIDLAGGTIDIWPLYLSHPGASTVNAAISLRARATIEPRADGRVGLQSIDTHKSMDADRGQDLDPNG